MDWYWKDARLERLTIFQIKLYFGLGGMTIYIVTTIKCLPISDVKILNITLNHLV